MIDFVTIYGGRGCRGAKHIHPSKSLFDITVETAVKKKKKLLQHYYLENVKK